MDWYIETSPAEMRACGTDEHGTLMQVKIERFHNPTLVGGVYAGRVRSVDANMGGAFIDIGLPKKNGRDNFAFLAQGHGLKEGDMVIVQVSRDGFGGKTVGLSRQISYYDRYFTLRKNIKGVQYARNLGQGRNRAETEKELSKALERRDNIVVNAPAHALAGDIFETRLDNAYDAWQSWTDYNGDAPTCLQPAPSMVASLVMDTDVDSRIMFSHKADALKWENDIRTHAPDLVGNVMAHDNTTPLFEESGMEDALDELLSRHVPLEGGGSIVIDHTEAMTVIDVNSQGATGLDKGDEALQRINKKACRAIARQIRARNLAGMIVIDFISIKNKGVLKRLCETMRSDCRKAGVDHVDVLGMTPGGLMEMTRKRTSPSVIEMLCTPSHIEQSPVTIGASLLRGLTQQTGAGKPEIIAPQNVLDALNNQLSDAKKETARIMGQDIILTLGNTPESRITR